MIVCWFSCGAASACATKLAIEKYGRENIRVVNNPVINEHIDNKRFLEIVKSGLVLKLKVPLTLVLSIVILQKYLMNMVLCPHHILHLAHWN